MGPIVDEKSNTVANLSVPFEVGTSRKNTESHLRVVKVFTISVYTVLAIMFVAVLVAFAYRTYVVKKKLSFYQVRLPKVQRKMIVFRTKKFNYGRDTRGRWRKWVRPSYKPKLYRPYQYSNNPQLGQSLEEVEVQPFVRSTLRIDPDYLHDESVRLACSHTTFVCEDEVPIRRAPSSFGPSVSPRRYDPQTIGKTYAYFDCSEGDESQSDVELNVNEVESVTKM